MKRRGVKNVVFVRGDAMYLPFKKGAFDVVISSVVIPFLRSDSGAISEMSVILNNKGKIYLKLHGLGYHLRRFRETGNVSWLFREFFNSFVSILTGRKLFSEPYSFQFPYKIRAILRNNGFRTIRIVPSGRLVYDFFNVSGDRSE